METPLDSIRKRAFLANRPLHASLELTYTCNLHCRYCYNPVERKGQTGGPRTGPPGPPLRFGEILSLLDQLAAMGVLYLTLTGGEPMLHPEFWEIVREAKRRAFALRIFTNATLIGEREADRFADLCPNCLEISIHGATAATAFALNQTEGAHERLLDALELLRARGLRVFLKCIVTRLLEDEIERIQDLGDRLGFPVYFDAVLSPSDDGLAYPMALQASDEALRRLFASPRYRVGLSPFERQDGEPACGVASGAMHIDPCGTVMPCIQWREPLGNLREKPLLEIWETAPQLDEIREISRRVSESLKGSAPDHAFCQHCPGLSKLRYGDPLKPDGQHLRVARIRREVWERDPGRGDIP
jgi:MoaA/NifB/PqqE/SkfB family radical SAM enzyme